MANYTEHYGLHQWAPEDDFLRTDFNTDFALIDAALAGLAAADASESAARSQEDGELSAAITAGDNAQAAALASAKAALQSAITAGDNALDADKAKVVWGRYTGNGAASRFISLGFTPSLVMVTDQEDTVLEGGVYYYGGIAVTGAPAPGVEIAANGFNVKNDGGYVACNYADPPYNVYRPYLYIAVQ